MKEQQLHRSQLNDLTYLQPNLKDNTLDDNLSISTPPSHNGHTYGSSTVDLGVLDKLPLELLQFLLSQLDLRTFETFRRVNQRALEVTESIPQYKAIATHARTALRGILSIETGPWITCEILYEKLCTAQCEECGDFGGYLYLLTCKRVCFLCFTETWKYLPLPYSEAFRKWGATTRILSTVPRLRSVPGVYSPNGMKRRDRLCLVDPLSAYDACIAHYGSSRNMEFHVSEVMAHKLEQFRARMSQASMYGSPSPVRRPRRPRTQDFSDGLCGNPTRFFAIVRTPWLDRHTQDLEWGFHCIGCQNDHDTRPLHYRRKFTKASFVDHLRQCGKISDSEHRLD